MTNFQDVVEYRGSGILFSTRKGLRKEVTQRLGRFEYLSAKIFSKSFFAPLSLAKFFPTVEHFESHKERQSAFKFGVFVSIFLRRKQETLRCRYCKCKTILFEYQRTVFFSFSLNALCCQSCLCRSLSLSSFLFPLFNFSLRLSSRVSRIRSRSLWHSSLSK